MVRQIGDEVSRRRSSSAMPIARIQVEVYRVTKILGVLEAHLFISTDRYELSLRNFGLNLFQAQTFGLWNNEHYKHK
jgi:hypothetical protein